MEKGEAKRLWLRQILGHQHTHASSLDRHLFALQPRNLHNRQPRTPYALLVTPGMANHTLLQDLQIPAPGTIFRFIIDVFNK